MENRPHTILMYFVPLGKIKQALVDMQHSWECGFSWVKACDYLSDERKYAVQVVMSSSYPYLENQWKKWEEA